MEGDVGWPVRRYYKSCIIHNGGKNHNGERLGECFSSKIVGHGKGLHESREDKKQEKELF